MTKIFTLLLMILREVLAYFAATDDARLNELKKFLVDFGLCPFLVRCFDFEDHAILRTTLSFLTEFADEKIALEMVRRGLFTRVGRFFSNKQFGIVFQLLSRLLVFQSVRDELQKFPFILKKIAKVLEQNQIAQGLQLLNFLSLDSPIVDALLESEVEVSLMNLLLLFLKKDAETVEKNKLLWNVLINFCSHSKFGDKILHPKIINPIFDFLFKTRSPSAFKMLENVFTFAKNEGAKALFGHQTTKLLELLEENEETGSTSLASTFNILAEIYNLKERKAITVMMKILKKKQLHPNIFIASFNFLNKALYAPNFDKEIVNGTVIDYCVKKFLTS